MADSNFVTTQYILGRGSLERLGDYKGKKMALVVDDFIIKALGLEEKLYQEILKDVDFKVICSMPKEPDMEILEEPIKIMREYEPDVIVGIGGGSVMDTAKALWLFYELPEYTWEQAMIPYQVEKFPGKAVLIAVPTTSGTGSETTGCAVVKDYEKKKKMILSNEIIPKTAILDFDLLKSLPLKNISFSGTDALAHALEAAVSVVSNGMVKAVGIQAAVMLIRSWENRGTEIRMPAKMYILQRRWQGRQLIILLREWRTGWIRQEEIFVLPHGLMTGMLLPYTMNYLMPQPVYEKVAEQLGIEGSGEEKQKKLIEKIWALYDEIQMPKTLKEAGVPEKEYRKKYHFIFHVL